jgi:hypothetical protein
MCPRTTIYVSSQLLPSTQPRALLLLSVWCVCMWVWVWVWVFTSTSQLACLLCVFSLLQCQHVSCRTCIGVGVWVRARTYYTKHTHTHTHDKPVLYVSSYCYVCPHSTTCVLILLYVCLHPTYYVSLYYYILRVGAGIGPRMVVTRLRVIWLGEITRFRACVLQNFNTDLQREIERERGRDAT